MLKPLFDQPGYAISILLIIGLISIWGYLVTLIRALETKANKVVVVFCAVMMAMEYFEIQCLVGVLQWSTGKFGGFTLIRTFGNLSFLFVLIITILYFVFLVIFTYRLSISLKGRVSPASVKESLDSLPTGLCYYLDSGLIRLINRAMLEILVEGMEGTNPENGQKLYESLVSGNAGETPISLGNTPVYELKDGRYIEFHFSNIDYEGKLAHEILAIDVTDSYLMSQEIEKQNSSKIKSNLVLKELDENIRNVTIQKEELNAKMRIHDNLGQAGLMARRYLEKGYNPEEKEKLLTMWKRNVDFLQAEDGEVIGPMERIIQTAINVGIDLEIDGSFPEGEEQLKIVADAMHECLTNTIRHAGGDVMQIKISYEDGMEMVISNNGAAPSGPIREGGGLSNLRKAVEGAGGTMKVLSNPRFELIIHLK